MEKNILLIKSCNKNWLEISKNIKKKFSFNKIYWLSHNKVNEKNCINSEDVLLINNNVFSKKNIDTCEINFDAHKFLSQYQDICNELLDRVLYDFQDVYFENRRRYLINLFDHCLKILTDYNIDTVISRRAPHRLIDYMIYLACQFKKKTFLYFDLTTEILPNLNKNNFEMMTYISDNVVENKTKNIFKRKNKSSLLKSKIYINRIKNFQNGYIPKYSSQNYKNYSFNFYFKKYVPIYFFYIRIFFLSFLVKTKEFKLKLDLHNNNLIFKKASNYEILIDNIKLEKKVIKYKSLYDAECVKLKEINENFIFFPLGRDREKNSCPDGEELRDINNILDYLIKYLPKKLLILIKDHPGNFRESSITNTNRSPEFFYNIIKKSDRIKLINIKENSNDILKKSKGVICLNGTLAWEAIIKNIPSCIFGNSWYQDCTEIIKINKSEDFKKFIYKLNHDKNINISYIEDFLSKVYKNCIPENFDRVKKIKKIHINYILNEIQKRI